MSFNGLSISFSASEDGTINVNFNNLQNTKTERKEKGHSIIKFPSDYTVIDIETTGLSPSWDEIIELSAIKYRNNTLIDEFSTLVKPTEEIDEFITELTGITNEMLSSAPSIQECIESFFDFIGDDIVVGYNVSFDINFIYDNCVKYLNKPFTNDFIDVMRISRKALPQLKHHRQKDTAKFFQISSLREHRALDDCKTCNECYHSLELFISENISSLNDFCDLFKKHRSTSHSLAKNIKATTDSFNEDHPLFEKVCVFTGVLDKIKRQDAMQIVADLGGIPADSVTKKTNFLILGNNDYCKTIKDGKSSKQKKAEKLILEGSDLQIITEQVFYDMLES